MQNSSIIQKIAHFPLIEIITEGGFFAVLIKGANPHKKAKKMGWNQNNHP
jgi:hypothetical protein